MSLKLRKPIFDLTPFTLLDFPGRAACIFWFPECNFRCPYCYNISLLENKGDYELEKAFDFLRKRIGKLDGVVFSGGEPTLREDLYEIAEAVKNMGFSVKLDTNGSNPEIISKLVKNSSVDFISLDYKAPPEKFQKLTGTSLFSKFSETLDFLITRSTLDFEVRTTVHTNLLQEKDINKIIDDLLKRKFNGKYCIQNFLKDSETLGKLKNQKRKLDKNKITASLNIEYRNF